MTRLGALNGVGIARPAAAVLGWLGGAYADYSRGGDSRRCDRRESALPLDTDRRAGGSPRRSHCRAGTSGGPQVAPRGPCRFDFSRWFQFSTSLGSINLRLTDLPTSAGRSVLFVIGRTQCQDGRCGQRHCRAPPGVRSCTVPVLVVGVHGLFSPFVNWAPLFRPSVSFRSCLMWSSVHRFALVMGTVAAACTIESAR